MTQPSVSVVVVSQGRPDALARCLRGIFQLRYDPMEVVVVADAAGLAAVAPWNTAIKTVGFDGLNISAARNAGIAVAAGQIVAFLDDDAVPEPSWLQTLVTGFALPDVVAAGGFVRGRNGISFQWKAQATNAQGESVDLVVTDGPSVPEAPAGYTVRTQGTNMAFKRDALIVVGGFDPAFRFYLDETELHLRLASQGRTAIVPGAEVHHGYMAGPYRLASRLPTSLRENYASHAVLMRKHAPGSDTLSQLLSKDRARLARHLVRGTCEPRDIRRLITSAKAGWADGLARPYGEVPDLTSPPPAFRAVPSDGRIGPTALLSGRPWFARKLRAQAAKRAANGETVTLFLFGPSVRYHRVRYRPEGFWEQSGGTFGRSERSMRFFTPSTLSARLNLEQQRVAIQRLIDQDR